MQPKLTLFWEKRILTSDLINKKYEMKRQSLGFKRLGWSKSEKKKKVCQHDGVVRSEQYQGRLDQYSLQVRAAQVLIPAPS